MGLPLALCLAISMLLGSVSTPDPELAQGVSHEIAYRKLEDR